MDMSLSKLQEMVEDREAWVLQSMGSQRVSHDLVTEQQQSRLEDFEFSFPNVKLSYLFNIHAETLNRQIDIWGQKLTEVWVGKSGNCIHLDSSTILPKFSNSRMFLSLTLSSSNLRPQMELISFLKNLF